MLALPIQWLGIPASGQLHNVWLKCQPWCGALSPTYSQQMVNILVTSCQSNHVAAECYSQCIGAWHYIWRRRLFPETSWTLRTVELSFRRLFHKGTVWKETCPGRTHSVKELYAEWLVQEGCVPRRNHETSWEGWASLDMREVAPESPMEA